MLSIPAIVAPFFFGGPSCMGLPLCANVGTRRRFSKLVSEDYWNRPSPLTSVDILENYLTTDPCQRKIPETLP